MHRHPYWTGFAASIIIVLLFFASFVGNITKPLSLVHNDVYQNMFIIKHVMNSLRSWEWQNLPNLPMFHGFADSYFFNEPFLIHAVVGLPIYMATGDVVVTYNVLALLTILVSFFAVYVFALHITHAPVPSLVAASIAVLNPFVVGRFPDHINLVTLVFLPLIFLLVERILKHPTPTNCVLFFLVLTGQAVTSFYYFAFLTLILPIYVVIRFWQEKMHIRHLIQWGTMVGIVIFLAVIGSLIAIYSRTFFLSETSTELDRRQLLYFSAWPSDWAFTHESNVLYGAFRSFMTNKKPYLIHQGTPSEQNLFPGITALVLWVLAVIFLPKSDDKKRFFVFAGISLFSLLLSFGPVVHITKTLTIPGIFDVVAFLDPALRMTRVAARFGVFVFLFGGIIAGMILARFSAGRRRFAWVIPVFVLVLILMEYWSKPLQFLSPSPSHMKFYRALSEQKHIRVILDVPVGNAMLATSGQVRQEYMDAHYMLWATIAHNKKLLGGYMGFMPYEHYVRMQTIATGFPSPETVVAVRQWGADAVVLHQDEYVHPTDYHLAKVKLTSMGVPLLLELDGLALFDLTEQTEVK